MAKEWRHLVDDLEPGDRIEIDCGDTMIAGKFVRIIRDFSRRWVCDVTTRGQPERVAMSEIRSIRHVGT